MPHAQPLEPGTHRERESEAAQETPGAAIWRLKQRGWDETWGQLERLAQDRDAWRDLVGGLCSCRGQTARDDDDDDDVDDDDDDDFWRLAL